MSEHHSHTIRVYPASQQQVLGMQRMQLEYYYTQGIPTENISGPQHAH
jgi:hypothetical protein